MEFRNKIIFLGFLFFTIPTLLFAQKKEFQLSALAFYNLENLFHPSDEAGKFDEDFTPTGTYRYTEEIYRKKLHNMAYALSQIAIDKIPEGPVLIGLAEVENALVLQDLIDQPELKSRNWKFIHFDSPDARGIDVALFYNPSYFKVLSAKALPVVILENGKRRYTRDVLYVVGELAKDTLHVFVNHWPSRYGGEAATVWKREKAAEVNKLVIDSLVRVNPNVKAVVMGDLNDDPNSPSVAVTLGAEGSKKKVKAGGLFNPWMSFFKKGYGTLGYNDSWNLFDQIIITSAFIDSKAKGWQFYQAEIFNKKFLITQFGKYKGYPHRSFLGSTWIDGFADHFPTLIYLIKEIY